jgi:outer membrane lipoprotein SlyB
MMKKCFLAAAVFTLAACGPAQPPADPNAASPPPTAAAPQAAPAPAPVSNNDEEIRAQERKLARLKREEADLRARNQAAQYPPPPPPQAACLDCGVVASITPVRHEGQAGLVGTLGGAAAGGLAGNQFGKGKGNIAMTALGVVGGAFAGREVEKQVNASTVYRVAVNMETGGTRDVTIDTANGLAIGTRVHVNGNNLMPY